MNKRRPIEEAVADSIFEDNSHAKLLRIAKKHLHPDGSGRTVYDVCKGETDDRVIARAIAYGEEIKPTRQASWTVTAKIANGDPTMLAGDSVTIAGVPGPTRADAERNATRLLTERGYEVTSIKDAR